MIGTGADRRGRVVRAAALLTAVAVTAGGCGVVDGGLRGVSLPGGANLGDEPYSVQIEFPDVVDLVPQSVVRYGDVPIGSVESVDVEPDSWNALVTVNVNSDVELPANATARVRTTSLLGEKFVALDRPPGPAEGSLAQSGRIPLQASGRAAEVEEVLGALSLLLNGGGVAQIRTISTELNNALSGREPEIRGLLDNLDRLVGSLDDSRDDINRALDGLDRLSATLAERRPQIRNALQNISPGLRELEDQRAELVGMLQALDRLSGVATDVVNRSRDDLLADLEALRPVLRNLADSGQDLPESLELLLTIPFTDAATDAVAGDYANLYVTVDADLGTILGNILRSRQLGLPVVDQLAQLPPTAQLLTPLLGGSPPAEQPAPGVPQLPLLGPEQETPAPEPEGGATPVPEGGAAQPTAPSGSPSATPTPTPTPGSGGSGDSGGGGLLGGLFGGGS